MWTPSAPCAGPMGTIPAGLLIVSRKLEEPIKGRRTKDDGPRTTDHGLLTTDN